MRVTGRLTWSRKLPYLCWDRPYGDGWKDKTTRWTEVEANRRTPRDGPGETQKGDPERKVTRETDHTGPIPSLPPPRRYLLPDVRSSLNVHR